MAVSEFYDAAFESAFEIRPDMPPVIGELIMENVALARKGQVEFKVCRQHFVGQLREAGLRLLSEREEWPRNRQLTNDAGNYVFVWERPGT